MLRFLALFWAIMAAALIALPGMASAAPYTVNAWYMYSSTPDGLKAEAYSHGLYFAKHHPGGDRLMVLDFGAARKVASGTWGTISFSSPSTAFTNAEILAALEAAADGVHNGHQPGSTSIAYGNSNYHLAQSGMSPTDAYYAGYYQSMRSEELADYQASKDYSRQSAVIATDIEPSWDEVATSKRVIDGVYDQGWALQYNFGSADGCPATGNDGLCNNNWTVADLAYVSYAGATVPLPEIYYRVNADQWTVIRRWWDKNKPFDYYFFGTTAELASNVLTPAQGWDVLSSKNPNRVLSELVCFGCES